MALLPKTPPVPLPSPPIPAANLDCSTRRSCSLEAVPWTAGIRTLKTAGLPGRQLGNLPPPPPPQSAQARPRPVSPTGNDAAAGYFFFRSPPGGTAQACSGRASAWPAAEEFWVTTVAGGAAGSAQQVLLTPGRLAVAVVGPGPAGHGAAVAAAGPLELPEDCRGGRGGERLGRVPLFFPLPAGAWRRRPGESSLRSRGEGSGGEAGKRPRAARGAGDQRRQRLPRERGWPRAFPPRSPRPRTLARPFPSAGHPSPLQEVPPPPPSGVGAEIRGGRLGLCNLTFICLLVRAFF